MRNDVHFSWGWAPHYLVASRWAPPSEYEPVSGERAAAVIERLVHDDPAALRAMWTSTGLLEPDQVEALSDRELLHRLLEDLEQPTGRLGLYARSDRLSFGTLDTTLEGAIVDLVELMDQSDEHGEPRGPA